MWRGSDEATSEPFSKRASELPEKETDDVEAKHKMWIVSASF